MRVKITLITVIFQLKPTKHALTMAIRRPTHVAISHKILSTVYPEKKVKWSHSIVIYFSSRGGRRRLIVLLHIVAPYNRWRLQPPF